MESVYVVRAAFTVTLHSCPRRLRRASAFGRNDTTRRRYDVKNATGPVGTRGQVRQCPLGLKYQRLSPVGGDVGLPSDVAGARVGTDHSSAAREWPLVIRSDPHSCTARSA